MLTRWAADTNSGARILAESTDPFQGGAPTFDRGYWRRNVREGRMGGQVRLRTRYRAWATPWFDWLFVSRRDMAALLGGTGWHQTRVLGGARGDAYVALLEKG